MKLNFAKACLCVVLGTFAVAQNVKISQLAAGAPAQSTDLLPVARSGANVSLKVADIISFLGAVDVDALYSGSGKCYLFKGTSPGSNDGCDTPAGVGGMVYPGAGIPFSVSGTSWGTSFTKFGSAVGIATSSDPGATAEVPMVADGTHGQKPSASGALNTGAFAAAYSLPTATNNILGGVKPDGTSILNTNGAISVTAASVGAAASNASTSVNGQTCALSGSCTVADSTKVPTSTTVNGHALSANVTVSASDITTGTLPTGQLPSITHSQVDSSVFSTGSTAHQLVAPIQCADTSSSSTAYTCAPPNSYSVPAAGDVLVLSAINQNSGASPTLAVGGGAAHGIYKWQGTAALASGDLQAGAAVVLTYDGNSHWEAQDIGNAPSGGGGLSGMTQYGLPVAATASTATSSVQPASWTSGLTFVPVWQPSGSAVAPTTADMTYAAALSYTPANCTAGTTGSDCLQLAGGLVPVANLPAQATIVNSGSISVTANNTYAICTSTCTVTPIQAAAGVQLCVRNAPGSATVITMAALNSSNYYELTNHTGWGTANHTVVSGGLATDSICIVGYDATHYAVFSSNGSWTD